MDTGRIELQHERNDDRPHNEMEKRGFMRSRSRWSLLMRIALVLVLAAGACRDNEDSTACSSDADCTHGTCLVAPVSHLEFCADVARGCPTGHRWANSAGDGLAGLCVELTTVDAGADAPTNVSVDAAVVDAP